MRLPDYLRRPIRFWLIAFVTLFLAQIGGVTPGPIPEIDTILGAASYAAWNASIGFLGGFLLNALEDRTPMPALLKGPPSLATWKRRHNRTSVWIPVAGPGPNAVREPEEQDGRRYW